MIKLRPRVTLTFEQRLAVEALRFKQAAKGEPPGSMSREVFLRRARQAETASHISEWLRSPRLAVAHMSDRKSKAPVIVHAADARRRARKLPIGTARNNLRQLAQKLLKRHGSGLRANVDIVEKLTRH